MTLLVAKRTVGLCVGIVGFVVSLASGASAQAPSPLEAAKQLLVVRNFVDAERQLTALAAERPTPELTYYLGVTLRGLGRTGEALETFRAANRLANIQSQPMWQLRSLYAVAQTLESDPTRRREAQSAWLDLSRFVQGRGETIAEAVAQTRTQALVMISEIAEISAAVRAKRPR